MIHFWIPNPKPQGIDSVCDLQKLLYLFLSHSQFPHIQILINTQLNTWREPHTGLCGSLCVVLSSSWNSLLCYTALWILVPLASLNSQDCLNWGRLLTPMFSFPATWTGTQEVAVLILGLTLYLVLQESLSCVCLFYKIYKSLCHFLFVGFLLV